MQVYHFCHKYGKQDTFYCPYGTIFNEYLGTCDYKNNVKCSGSGKGYKGPLPKPHPEPHHHEEHSDGYHAPPKPYKHHVSYHEHEQYHHSSPPHDSYGPPPVHHDSYQPPHHDSYEPPHHDTYAPPHHDSYEPPHHDSYGHHQDSYHHEPPSYHVDGYEEDDGYNGFRGDSSFIDGFGSGFGKENGFGGAFGSQKIRRSGKKSNSPLISTSRRKVSQRRQYRPETPRNIKFKNEEKDEYKNTPSSSENEFGFDELKAFGFGLRV